MRKTSRIKIQLIDYVLDIEHRHSKEIIDAIVAEDYDNIYLEAFYEEEKEAAADVNDTEIVDMLQQLITNKHNAENQKRRRAAAKETL